MIKFIREFFSDSNKVNEDTVMGFLCFVAAVVAGFVPAVPSYVFYTFFGGFLSFFGKKIADNIINSKK